MARVKHRNTTIVTSFDNDRRTLPDSRNIQKRARIKMNYDDDDDDFG